MLDIEKATNRGNQFLRDHHSSRFVKRVEKAAQSPAEMAGQPSELGEKSPNTLRDWFSASRIGGRSDSGGMGGDFGSMIRHANLGDERGGRGHSTARISLGVAMYRTAV